MTPEQAVSAVRQGIPVECTAEEWPPILRALLDAASKFLDHGDAIRASIALQEARRGCQRFAETEAARAEAMPQVVCGAPFPENPATPARLSSHPCVLAVGHPPPHRNWLGGTWGHTDAQIDEIVRSGR